MQNNNCGQTTSNTVIFIIYNENKIPNFITILLIFNFKFNKCNESVFIINKILLKNN